MLVLLLNYYQKRGRRRYAVAQRACSSSHRQAELPYAGALVNSLAMASLTPLTIWAFTFR